MQREEMNRLIEQHLTAERAGNLAGCVAMYTDDVIHDVVGSPAGPLQGPDAARGFYEMLTQNIKTEQMDVRHAWYGSDFCVIEHQWNGTVPLINAHCCCTPFTAALYARRAHRPAPTGLSFILQIMVRYTAAQALLIGSTVSKFATASTSRNSACCCKYSRRGDILSASLIASWRYIRHVGNPAANRAI